MDVVVVVYNSGVSVASLEEEADGATRLEGRFPLGGVRGERRRCWPQVFKFGVFILASNVVVIMIKDNDLMHKVLEVGVFVIHASEEDATPGEYVHAWVQVTTMSIKEEGDGVTSSGGSGSNHRDYDILEMSKS